MKGTLRSQGVVVSLNIPRTKGFNYSIRLKHLSLELIKIINLILMSEHSTNNNQMFKTLPDEDMDDSTISKINSFSSK